MDGCPQLGSWRAAIPAFAVLLIACAAARADFQGATHMMPFEEDAISYAETQAAGPVARLRDQLEQGVAQFQHDPVFGYLPALLEQLGVSADSQMLVFSKTSLQREHISPRTPRALYFNDDAYVGFIPGAPMIEVSEVDPKLGAVFYTLDQSEASRPRLVRTDQCLECHASSKSLGVPGHLARSFVTKESGVVDLASGISPITHRTPLADRWGGWYVSGDHGDQLHRGNLIGVAAFERQETEPNSMGNQADLTRFFDSDRYLNQHSDIVALMALEHQTHMHNLITRLKYAATISLLQYGHIKYLNSVSEAFLKYLLFTEEVPLTAPIKGTSGFTERFARLGPRDGKGRSLRDFDLQTRMFKYPCSFLIYSDAFDTLPDPLKEDLYRRLWKILTADAAPAPFDHIAPETRRAILEILVDTKPDLPDSWRTENATGID